MGIGRICLRAALPASYMLLLLLLISSYDPYASSSFTSVDKPQTVNPQNIITLIPLVVPAHVKS